MMIVSPLRLSSERTEKVWSLAVFNMGWHVSSYMKGFLINVPEGRALKTTTVKEPPGDNEMNVTLSRPFLSWCAAECLICQATSNSSLLGTVYFLQRPAPPTPHPTLMHPPSKETIYNIICLQHFPTMLRDILSIFNPFYVDLSECCLWVLFHCLKVNGCTLVHIGAKMNEHLIWWQNLHHYIVSSNYVKSVICNWCFADCKWRKFWSYRGFKFKTVDAMLYISLPLTALSTPLVKKHTKPQKTLTCLMLFWVHAICYLSH